MYFNTLKTKIKLYLIPQIVLKILEKNCFNSYFFLVKSGNCLKKNCLFCKVVD